MAAKENVKLRPPRPVDSFTGDPTGPVTSWDSLPAVRATVVPRESQEDEQRGTIIIHGFLVRLPAGTPINDHYELLVRGETHQIEGAVGDFGRKGLIVYTKRAN